MNKLIIDITNEKIFLMMIINTNIYNITHESTKINFESLTIIINNFLSSKKLKVSNINEIYVNQGTRSFAGIRNSLSIVKAFNLVHKIDYYCFSFKDFENEIDIEYENIPRLCSKFNLKKNLIKPYYIS